MVYGADPGGLVSYINTSPGTGGAGYSEKYYSNPTGSYTVTIGAKGTVSASPTAGGTTSFDTMSVVSANPTTNSTAGTAGGTASGGDVNFSGGSGGNGSSTTGGSGGSGGHAGRSGPGGNGSSGSGATLGAGGGTGGNNASGGTPGIAATTLYAGVRPFPSGVELAIAFNSGGPTTTGANGAEHVQSTYPIGTPCISGLNAPYVPIFDTGAPEYLIGRGKVNSTSNPANGLVQVMEWLK